MGHVIQLTGTRRSPDDHLFLPTRRLPPRRPTASTRFSAWTGCETQGWGMELFGRGVEIAELDRVLARASDGAGSALVLWGEPGIGKTALLEYAAHTAATDVTVLRCRGTRMEAGIAFAALHELLWPVMDRLATLAAPQAAALRGALGLSRDETNRFLVGAAVLSLVCDMARECPVLVVVDDAQWVDEATAHCLGFLARRIGADPVAVLLTGHEDPHSGPWEGPRSAADRRIWTHAAVSSQVSVSWWAGRLLGYWTHVRLMFDVLSWP